MADVVNETLEKLNETLKETAKNATGKKPASPEGMAMAYGSLFIMALIPIFFGSFRSVKYHKAQKVRPPRPYVLFHMCICACMYMAHTCTHAHSAVGWH
jgi:hypothetical protein